MVNKCIIIDDDLLPIYDDLKFIDKDGKQIFRYSENKNKENKNGGADGS